VTEPQEGGPRPQVYARLAHEAEDRLPPRPAPRWARPAGWLIAAALVVTVVVAAVRVHPWG
jgi:hypothetical protein